jgi:hypothetical protein
MSSTLVHELQSLASSNSTDLTELLRKTLMVASKLSLDDLKQWATHELQGYPDVNSLPEYRFVHAELKARNPFHGLVPVLIDNFDYMQKLCNVPIMQSVSGLADLLKNPRQKGNALTIPFSHVDLEFLLRMQDSRAPLEPVRTVGENQVAAILDTVRTKILNWSLELEREGILGQGMTFSKEEKTKASSSITIENFQGVFGNIENSTVTQKLEMTVTSGDFDSLSRCLSSLGLTTKDIADLKEAINVDPKPKDENKLGPSVSNWMGSMLSRAATGAWSIGISAAGGTLARAIGKYYGF